MLSFLAHMLVTNPAATIKCFWFHSDKAPAVGNHRILYRKIITSLASVKGFELLFRIDRLKIKLVADDHKEMKFAVKYSKTALVWSHSVPQSYWVGVGAGSNLTCVQCLVGSVWSRREKELGEMFAPDICTQLWLWALKERQSGLTEVACVPHATDEGGSWIQLTPPSDTAEQHPAIQATAQFWPQEGLQPPGTLRAAETLLRHSGKFLLNSPSNSHAHLCQVTPDCLLQSKHRLPVPFLSPLTPPASGRWHVLHDVSSACSSGWLPQSKRW